VPDGYLSNFDITPGHFWVPTSFLSGGYWGLLLWGKVAGA